MHAGFTSKQYTSISIINTIRMLQTGFVTGGTLYSVFRGKCKLHDKQEALQVSTGTPAAPRSVIVKVTRNLQDDNPAFPWDVDRSVCSCPHG